MLKTLEARWRKAESLWPMTADFINEELQRPAKSLLYSLGQTTRQSGDSTEVVLYIQ